jgi:hypothetical protein
MSVSMLEEQAGDVAPGATDLPAERLPAESASPRRFAFSAQSLLPRAYDAIVVLWLTVFHHVLGVKYRFAQIAYDEHFFLIEGWSVLKGQIPYRDFQEFKPPVIFFVHALAIKLFGMEGLGYRKFLALLSLVSFLALAVALLSRRVHRLIVVAALMLMINHFYDDGLHNEVINDAETLALDFFMLGAGVLLTRTKWERTQQVLGGALLALSPLSKEPMAFATALAWLSLLLLCRIESGSKNAAKRFALFTIAGVASVAVTWLVYMLATRSLSWYILQLKLSFAYTENYAYQLRWGKRNPPGGLLAEMYRRLTFLYVNLPHLGVFIPFFLALLTLPGKRRLMIIGAAATFLASLYAVSVGGGYAGRYFIMAMTGTFFCAALGAIALDALSKRWRRDLSVGAGAACVALAFATTWPRFRTEWKSYATYKPPPQLVPQSDIDFVLAHTSPGDKIWTTDDPLLCIYTDRENAFRGGIVLDEIIEYYPGNTDKERLSVIRQGLEENRPKLVVFGDSMVSARRKRRYHKVLTVPFLRDGGYIRLNDRFYKRPD